MDRYIEKRRKAFIIFRLVLTSAFRQEAVNVDMFHYKECYGVCSESIEHKLQHYGVSCPIKSATVTQLPSMIYEWCLH